MEKLTFNPVFVGRQGELEYLKQSILSNSQGFCLLGMPGIGKSSFLKYLYNWCLAEYEGDIADDNRIIAIYINLLEYAAKKRDYDYNFEKFVIKRIESAFADHKNRLRQQPNSQERNGNCDPQPFTHDDLKTKLDSETSVYMKLAVVAELPSISIVIMLDEIDDFDVVINAGEDEIRVIGQTVSQLRYFQEVEGCTLIISGRCTYSLTRARSMVDGYPGNDDASRQRLQEYSNILHSSSRGLFPFYLKPFKASEVEELCRKGLNINDYEPQEAATPDGNGTIESEREVVEVREQPNSELVKNLSDALYKQVGGNPSQLVNVLTKWVATEKSINLARNQKEINDSIKLCVGDLNPTLMRVCDRVWQYSLSKSDRDYLKRCAGEFDRPGKKVDDLNPQEEDFVERGLLVWDDLKEPQEEDSVERGVADDPKTHLILFSPLFLNRCRKGEQSYVPKSIEKHVALAEIRDTESSGLTFQVLDMPNGDVLIKTKGKDIELTGLMAKLFRLVWHNQGKTVWYETIKEEFFPDEPGNLKDFLNRIYQIKTQLDARLGALESVSLKSVPNRGYILIVKEVVPQESSDDSHGVV
jgi:hypothetical protein